MIWEVKVWCGTHGLMFVTIGALAITQLAGQSVLGHVPGAIPFCVVMQPVKQPETVLLAADIRASKARTALDAIRRLKPQFLRRRVIPSAWDPYDGFPAVYVDGILLGELRTLESIPAEQVVEIRYVTPLAYGLIHGASHSGGVISVRTKKSRR